MVADTAKYGMTDAIRAQYDALAAKAGECIQCGVCSSRCPFGVDAAANMASALSLFGA